MSIRVMTAVWADSAAKGSALLLLLAIADWANDAGHAYPGIEAMSAKVRMSERGVRYLLRGLTRSGELVVIEEARGRRTPRYLVCPGGQSLPLIEGGNLMRQGGKITSVGGQPIAPKPSVPVRMTRTPLPPKGGGTRSVDRGRRGGLRHVAAAALAVERAVRRAG